MKYVLVSGSFEMVDTPHKGAVLGQEFDMTDEEARSAILSGAHLLPKPLFDSQGFTAEELAKHSNARLQANAPAAFLAKRDAAIEAAQKHRAQLIEEEKKLPPAAPASFDPHPFLQGDEPNEVKQ